MAKLLIVDDEKNIRESLSALFEGAGHEVITAENGELALALFNNDKVFDLVLTDYRMAEVNGLELLQRIKRESSGLAVILMTAYATVENAVAAMKSGAVDYIAKPFTLEQIQHVVDRVLEVQSLRSENRLLREAIEEQPLLESRSPLMQRLLEIARQAAASEANILLTGESGVGKTVLARQIHYWSSRRAGPFVVVNCTTHSEPFLESELFGHTRGSFAGAFKDKPGRLEAADHGTVFLDEIADLTPALQTKFLHFIQERSFERLGGDRAIQVDGRIIVASNRDLMAEVAAHRFREDLFYRLNVIALEVPPLRKRRTDIVPLAERLLSMAAVRNQRGLLHFSQEAVAVIRRYNWPGNVRELKNTIERVAVLTQGNVITSDYLPDALFRESTGPSLSANSAASLEEIEKEHIIQMLAETATHEDAAARLGIDVSTLWRKRKRYKID